MNKSIKLPLFLSLTCLIAGATLAIVNEITSPIILRREMEVKAAGYLSVLDLTSADGYYFTDPIASTGDLKSKGIETYVKVLVGDENGALFGLVYDVSTSGFDSGLKFQVGVKEGFFSGYNNIANSETPGYGKDLIEGVGGRVAINTFIKGLSATDPNAITAKFADPNISGVTMTGNAISSALVAISTHYNSEVGN